MLSLKLMKSWVVRVFGTGGGEGDRAAPVRALYRVVLDLRVLPGGRHLRLPVDAELGHEVRDARGRTSRRRRSRPSRGCRSGRLRAEPARAPLRRRTGPSSCRSGRESGRARVPGPERDPGGRLAHQRAWARPWVWVSQRPSEMAPGMWLGAVWSWGGAPGRGRRRLGRPRPQPPSSRPRRALDSAWRTPCLSTAAIEGYTTRGFFAARSLPVLFLRLFPAVGAWLSLARALGSGPRGRRFESSRPDHHRFNNLHSA